MADRTVLLFTGGDPVDPSVALRLPADAFVIAADSGLAQAVALGRHVDLAVGDFDSVDPVALSTAEAAGTVIERHPTAKDETDLELGLVAAAAHGASSVIVVGGHGGRVDHFIAGALLLASNRFESMRITAHIGAAVVHVVRDEVVLAGEVGSIVSLLPVGGPALGVWTDGLEYKLAGETLRAGTTRGVSNVFVAPTAIVTVEDGVLLAVQP
ncbi:MAG TPA: thiamine diphosphokinase [Acidimicrobiales bacterium]|nr:thiamine diphosphokinase [Acidimicrobiales bacterium]